jgi:hypothetical protein
LGDRLNGADQAAIDVKTLILRPIRARERATTGRVESIRSLRQRLWIT